MNIVVLEADSVGTDVSWDALSKFGKVALYTATPQDLIVERIKDADIIIPNKCILNESNLSHASHLKLICEAATGYNNIDIDYCKKRGIPVTNVKAYSTDIVAQHTFALLLSLYNKIDYYATHIESGNYSNGTSFSHVALPFGELSGKCYGIIGMGNIGRKVAEIATAFGCNVIYYSASGHTYDVPYKAVSFDELLSQSDIISIHAPLNEKTACLMDQNAFSKMKQTALLINVARGPIVVEKDLVNALNNHEIAAAGLDVFEKEPLPKESPLLTIKDRTRLLMTPHSAWGSVEARTRLVSDVCLSIESFLNGTPRSLVY